jgi:hypothetical protein
MKAMHEMGVKLDAPTALSDPRTGLRAVPQVLLSLLYTTYIYADTLVLLCSYIGVSASLYNQRYTRLLQSTRRRASGFMSYIP